jgi:hypothetical protein
MRFLSVLPIFVFLTAGCTTQQDRVDVAQQRFDATQERVLQVEGRKGECLEKMIAVERGQPTTHCDMVALNTELGEAIDAGKAAYAELEAIPGAPYRNPPLDWQTLEGGGPRFREENSYASDCDRGQASACIQYQQALQQDREEEMQRHEDFERSLDLDLTPYLMTTP